MRTTILRAATVLALVAVVSVSGMSLFAEPTIPTQDRADAPNDLLRSGGRWIPCPVPSCAAPCIYPPEPQVRCRVQGGGPPEVTSFTCCCCGSGAGVFYRPL